MKRSHLWLVFLLTAAAAAVVRLQLVDIVTVSSASMAPTICRGDAVMLLRTTNGTAMRPNDIVGFYSPVDGGLTIKRVIAVAGQQVTIRDSQLVIDGQEINEPFVDHRSIDGMYTPLVLVPVGMLFVLGDNREQSIDSRSYGPIRNSAVYGRYIGTLWSGC